MHNKNAALRSAGVIFGLVAIGHLLRIINHSHIVFSGYAVPQDVSYIGLIIAVCLSVWMFVASK